MDYKDISDRSDVDNLNFWHQARLDLIYKLLNSFYQEDLSSRTILDLGCGLGTELEIISKFGRVSGLDINKEAILLARQSGFEVLLGNIEKIDLPPNHYDAICCFDLLEHLNDDQAVLNKIHLSLKEGGRLFFTVPAFQFLFSAHDLFLGHQRRYSKKEIVRKLRLGGFSRTELFYWNFILFLPLAFVRLFRSLFLIKIFKLKNFKSEVSLSNKKLNDFFFKILNLENKLLFKNKRLPFGLTIYGWAGK